MIKVFEAFAGIGAQRTALKNIGVPHEVVAISEYDEYPAKSYMAIHGETLNLGDITKIDVHDIPEHDLFTYSFPCQDISLAGKQKGLDKDSSTRSSLLWECERIIEHCRPKYLLLENVKNLVGKKHKDNFDEWLSVLDALGYDNYWQVLNAADYGIAQKRERVFVVSIRKDLKQQFEFPLVQKTNKTLKDYLDNNVDKKYYFDKSKIESILNWKSFQKPFNRVLGLGSVCPTLTARGCQGGNASMYVISEYLFKTTNFGEFSNDDSMCISQEQIDTIFNYRPRILTPLECWRLMGFSDGQFYKASLVNKESQLYKQAGNSICVPVLEAIFKELFKEELCKS